MNRKILFAILPLTVILLATPIVFAVPWTYPKNNEAFQKFETTISFDWNNLIIANYEATAGLGAGDANKIVVVYNEQAKAGYQIRIGEGASQKVYNLYDPVEETGDFVYTGVGTVVTYDPVLPYTFDYTAATLFIPGSKQHFRVDYMYDFSAVPGGLEGTITMLALVTGNGIILNYEKDMSIISVKGTGDFTDVVIHATQVPDAGHSGIVLGWP